MTRFVLPSVTVTDAGAACAACGHPLAPRGAPWKSGARLRDVPLAALGGPYDTGHPGVVLRQFACPGCGVLLDTETATDGEPPLADRLAP
ncbi:MAG: acetone carboxylase subunit gamma [Gemmobacter sp.]